MTQYIDKDAVVAEVDLEKEIEQYISDKGLKDYRFLIPSIA